MPSRGAFQSPFAWVTEETNPNMSWTDRAEPPLPPDAVLGDIPLDRRLVQIVLPIQVGRLLFRQPPVAAPEMARPYGATGRATGAENPDRVAPRQD
jgi:hypothetical protein